MSNMTKTELVNRILSKKEYKNAKISILYNMKKEDLEKLVLEEGDIDLSKIKRIKKINNNEFSKKKVEVFSKFENSEINANEVSKLLNCKSVKWYPQFKKWKDNNKKN